ncbi:MAG: aminoacyl-tRNA hydrolase [Patescibacteria group bacterium]
MLIIGLGNPGKKYEKNRHNVGRIFVEWLQNKLEMPDFKKDSSSSFYFTKDVDQNILVYPNNYMNLSGIAAGSSIRYFGIKDLSEVYIAHDDLDIPLGGLKIDFAKGPKLHNGISSIEEHLKTKDFYRIRIGVDNRNPENRIPGETYVLQNFDELELQKLEEDVFPRILSRLTLVA